MHRFKRKIFTKCTPTPHPEVPAVPEVVEVATEAAVVGEAWPVTELLTLLEEALAAATRQHTADFSRMEADSRTSDTSHF